MNEGGLGFHHVALKCRDFEKSIAFYGALGLREYARWGGGEREIALLELPKGGRLELFSDGGDAFSVNGKYIHFAFASNDVAGDYARALAAGASPLTEPKVIEVDSKPVLLTLEVAFVKGPDGEEIEFIRSTER